MKKEFTANILFLIGINLLIKPFYALAIDTSVQNIVGPEQYGLFLAIFNFIYIQQIFADLGIQNFNNRNISRNPQELSFVLPRILSSKLIFTLFFIFVTIFTSWIFGYLQYFNEILVWVIGSQATLSFLLYLRTNVSGTANYFTDSIFSVLDKLILIIWMSYVIWGGGANELTISYFAKVQFASLAISLFIVGLFTHKRLGRLSLSFDWSFMKKLLKESLPYASLVLLMAGYSRMDAIMLQQLLSDNALETGRYANSFRLYDTFNNFTFLFAVLLLPMFSRMIKKNEAVRELVSWAFKLLSLGSLFVIVMIYYRGNEIMSLFYPDREAVFPLTLFFLVCAGFALSLNYIYGTLLTANGDIRRLNQIAILGFLVNIAVNYLLIPSWKGEGAALATLVTQFLVLFLQIIYCYRKFDLYFSILNAGKVLVVTVACSGVFYVLTSHWQLNLLLTIAISGVITVFVAMVTRLVSFNDLDLRHSFAVREET